MRERPRVESGAAVRSTGGLPTASPTTHPPIPPTEHRNRANTETNNKTQTLIRCKNNTRRSRKHRDNIHRQRRKTQAATNQTQHTLTTTKGETTTQGEESRVRHFGSDHDKIRRKESSPTHIFKFRVFPLLTTWVLISTISLCACTHYTVKPSIPTYLLYSPNSHPPLHTLTFPPQSCLSMASTHKNYTLTSHPILYHSIPPIFYQQWPPPRSTSAPYTIHASSPPTHHNTAHTEVSKPTCTYHHTNATTKKNIKSKNDLSINLPPKRQGRCRRRSTLLRGKAILKAVSGER